MLFVPPENGSAAANNGNAVGGGGMDYGTAMGGGTPALTGPLAGANQAPVPSALIPPPVQPHDPAPSPYAPPPASPPAATVTPAPVAPLMSGPSAPAPAPLPPPSFVPTAPAGLPATNPAGTLTNPATGQSTSAIGTPTGYNVGNGIDTSSTALLPSNFSMSNLISPTNPADATTPSAASYANGITTSLTGPTPWNITAPQTVAGQYANLMSAGNPAIQAAEQSTIRANAANGGNNSLMAQTAATLAGSQVALTIAQQDAQVNAAAGQYNATQANAFAAAKNQFVENATLSQQNFEQGVAMLKDQTNQSMEQLYAQIEGSAVTASINLKSQLSTIQANTNATLETMDKTFAQTTATNATQEGYAQSNAAVGEGYNQANANQNYGISVRLAYLSAVGTQQTALMNTIASIQQNPNINTTQAQAGIKDAVDQFNSFMTMNNAYYSSMIPTTGASNPAAYLPGFPNN